MPENGHKTAVSPCPVRDFIDSIGDKWSILVLLTLHGKGVMRFNDLRRSVPDCSQKMLSVTLKKLEGLHLVERTLYPEVPVRVEYNLTDTGGSLVPNIYPFVEWANTHVAEIFDPEVLERTKPSTI